MAKVGQSVRSLARDISLKPQTRTILAHLQRSGSISPMESWGVYGIMRLAAAIHDIRRAGYEVSTDIRKDAARHTYARYSMAGAKKQRRAA